MGKEVVDIAKKHSADVGSEHRLSTGFRVRIIPVSARLLTESMARVPEPKVPMWWDKDREKEVENSGDPSYVRALEERETAQTNVAMDALIMFGVELVDGVPEDNAWVKKLGMLDRLGVINMSEYDLEDKIEREFVFKKFIAVSGGDLELLQGASGLVTAEDLTEAEDSFPDNEEPAADS